MGWRLLGQLRDARVPQRHLNNATLMMSRKDAKAQRKEVGVRRGLRSFAQSITGNPATPQRGVDAYPRHPKRQTRFNTLESKGDQRDVQQFDSDVDSYHHLPGREARRADIIVERAGEEDARTPKE